MLKTRIAAFFVAAFAAMGSALAENVVIGHFGDPLPVQAAVRAAQASTNYD